MLNGLMLFGMLGLSVPIIIHLIQKQRLQPQPLATMQFLDKEDVANAFAPTPRDLLQLLLRLLLLILFILLMARLTIGGSTVGPRTLAVILDGSMSMQQKKNDAQSLFDFQKAAVLQLIDGLGPEDRIALYLVGDDVITQTGFLDDKAEAKRIAEAFTVTDGGGLALMPTVRDAVNQLRARREVNACVLVYSDMQRRNVSQALAELTGGNTEGRVAAFREALEDGHVKLVLVDDHESDLSDVAVLSATLSPPSVHLGAGARMTADVQNRSAKEQNVTVTLSEGTTEAETRTLSLAAGETVRVDLVHRFESPLDTPVTVALGEDDLPGDDRYRLPMRMKNRRSILLVVPPTPDGGAETEMELGTKGLDLFSYALNPGEALGQGTDTYVTVKRISSNMLERVTLPVYSTIVLYGVTDLAEQSATDLNAFVRNGGGLYLIADPEMSPLRFNTVYAKVLGGFALGPPKEAEPVQLIATNEASVKSSLLLPLLHEEWGEVKNIWFRRYFSVESVGSAVPALVAGNGDWLAATLQLERGRVFIQGFSTDLDSTSLPRTSAFLPMVQTVVHALDSSDDDELRVDSMRVGDTLRLATPEYRGLSGDATVTGPATENFPLSGNEGDTLRVSGLLKAGNYEVTHAAKRTGRTRWLTVNPAADEADLAPMSDDDITTLFGSAQVAHVPSTGVAAQFSARTELIRPLLVLLLLAFVVEAVMGAWQSRSGARRDDDDATTSANGEGAV